MNRAPTAAPREQSPGKRETLCLRPLSGNCAMADGRRNIYWDANVPLTYINDITDLVPTLEALLEASASLNGDVKIYTSELSKVEVAFAATERERRALDPEIEQKINDLWNDPDAIVMVEFHDAIATIARNLMREALPRGWSLRPYDAVHLATAQWLSSSGIGIDEFHTYDTALHKYAPIVGFRILEPYTPQPNLL